jgi:uncharacterized OsmC-like protein
MAVSSGVESGTVRSFGTKAPFLAETHLTVTPAPAYRDIHRRAPPAYRRQVSLDEQENIAMSATPTQPTTTLNGLDTQKMVETVGALKANPALAKFEFRARNRWISGGENRSTIKDFYGAGAEDVSRDEPFEFTNGEPPVLLGHNEGANPVEFLLHALAGCVTTTTVLHAAARGIDIESLSTTLVGDIDLQGLLALGDVAPGYQSIRIEMDIKAKNASDTELDDLLQFAQAHSPVCNTVCRPVPVIVERVQR